uniref:Glucose-1-phosphate adenylyltransferase n=1 Tax=Oryza nivara TaxID=4536 RepID=A0A0E0HIZ3_ORYNI
MASGGWGEEKNVKAKGTVGGSTYVYREFSRSPPSPTWGGRNAKRNEALPCHLRLTNASLAFGASVFDFAAISTNLSSLTPFRSLEP